MIGSTLSLVLLAAYGASAQVATGSLFLTNLYAVLFPTFLYLSAMHADGYVSFYLLILVLGAAVAVLQISIWMFMYAFSAHFDGLALFINLTWSSLLFAISCQLTKEDETDVPSKD